MSLSPTLSLTPYRAFVLRYSRIFDVLALVVAAIACIAALVHLVVQDTNAGAYCALVAEVAGIALSRRFLWAGTVLFAVAPLIAVISGNDPQVTWTMSIVGVFYVCLRGLPALWVGLLVAALNYASVSSFDGVGLGATAPVAAVLAFAGAAAGSALRGQRQYWQELEQRARDALATRESEANRRVAEERLRIARDLHDVVGHEIALINMHLGLAEVGLEPGDTATRSSLHAAREGVQTVLRETQHILDVLRVDSDVESTRPVAAFEEIPDLVDSFRAVGLTVDLTLPAALRLGAEVSAAAYRIVQEALTNAQRHGTGSAQINAVAAEAVLTLTITNPVSPRAAPKGRAGYGLVGMRERAQSAGGHVSAEERSDMFTVTATLPIDGGVSQ